MTIRRFEDMEAWQLARELTCQVYRVSGNGAFAKDFELRGQIRAAAGSAMHNSAEGFDAGSDAEFARFLRIAQRSSTEVKSQLYAALDQNYVTDLQFADIYNQATRVHKAIGGLIRYLVAKRKAGRLAGSRPSTKHQAPEDH